MSSTRKKLVQQGELAAEVEVELITADDAWAPYLSLEDAERLDSVREALRRALCAPPPEMGGFTAGISLIGSLLEYPRLHRPRSSSVR